MRFLKIASVWFDPNRVESVTDASTTEAPACRVRFYSGDDRTFSGEEAKKIMDTLGKHLIRPQDLWTH